ncbi:MAG: N-acetylmuramoyl-L-alanine amidase [Lachnospiraceae bacterium]
MQEKQLKISTVILTLTVVIAAAVLLQFSKIHGAEKEKEQMSGLEMLDYYTAQAQEKETSFTQQLKLELPEDITLEEIAIKNDYVHQLITITVPGVEPDYFYEHPLLGKSSHINDLYMESGRIEITMDGVYEVKSIVDHGYLYIDFLLPREVYDKVIVIDAGHGGKAPGAIKQNIMEKDLNLGIVTKVKSLVDAAGQNIGVYYTRTEDNNPTFDQRVQLANKTNANLFISIHNNSTADGVMSEYSGTEVMYDELKSEEGLSSKHLADLCLEEMTGILGSKNNGATNGNSIYIIRSSQVPVALIEVGFMTNQEELNKLNSQEYQQLAAQGVYNCIMRAIQEGY